MFGKSGTIGLIVPSNNTVVEREFNTLIPDGYGVVAARMWNTRAEPDDLSSMPDNAVQAAGDLATAEVSVVAFACTSGSFIGGTQGESALRIRLESAAKAPAVTTSGAFIAALQHLGLKSVALATPYIDEVNESERQFMEANGIRVPSMRGLGITDSVKIGHVELSDTREIARQVDVPDADGIFISCTNLRSIGIIDELEQELGKPVISSNQATLWSCMRQLGHATPVMGAGSLLRDLAG